MAAIAVGPALLCRFTRINTVLNHGLVLISRHCQRQFTSSAFMANVIVSSTNPIVKLLALRFLDRWGRRALLLTGSAGLTIALVLFVITFRIPAAPHLLILTFILGYTRFSAFAMGLIPWIVISEVFTYKMRKRAASVATSTLWIATSLVTLTFFSLIQALGVTGTFSIYAVLSVFSFVFIWTKVPETRGKNLEQIQQEWEGITDAKAIQS